MGKKKGGGGLHFSQIHTHVQGEHEAAEVVKCTEGMDTEKVHLSCAPARPLPSWFGGRDAGGTHDHCQDPSETLNSTCISLTIYSERPQQVQRSAGPNVRGNTPRRCRPPFHHPFCSFISLLLLSTSSSPPRGPGEQSRGPT